jgi:hypothetical protein
MERLTLDELKRFYANKEAKEINVKIVTDLLEQVDRYLTNIRSYDLERPIESSGPNTPQCQASENGC